ncbi:MAG TPA: arsenate reductase ArsC [Gemmatimonadales bacterium]|nr:arsenate reductase ArsC [Gemmatimonadales bacterium]
MTGLIRVLFLCTGNSARSQIAEALLNWKGKGRFHAESAGSQPAPRVHPLAIETLAAHAIPWSGHAPRGLDAVTHQRWDLVITVCDRAKDACPVFPAGPVLAHWSIADPAHVDGDQVTRGTAFAEAFRRIEGRIDALLALPVETLEPLALAARVHAAS